MGSVRNNISEFFVAGINYRKTDASIRGQFAINNDQYAQILEAAPNLGLSELFILSTCNRTEIYGFSDDVKKLVSLLCSKTIGSREVFEELSYVKNGRDAVQHLFEVGAGLESQILGDYEIIGQIKLAVKFSKSHGFMGTRLERMLNSVLQSTKIIKNQTTLSGGTVSVSFAAVQYIRKTVTDISDKKILLLGVGKIGGNTCKNLVDYLKTTNIILINRTEEKAAELARELGLSHAPFSKLEAQIKAADIILVATNAPEPTILHSHLSGKGKKIIIDLSIPYNVEKSAEELENITLVNVDELSKLKDETFQKREAEVPKAKAIIEENIAEYLDWCDMRRNVPVIKAVKKKLNDMHECKLFMATYKKTSAKKANGHSIQKVLNSTAVNMRMERRPGCNFIQAINEFISTNSNN